MEHASKKNKFVNYIRKFYENAHRKLIVLVFFGNNSYTLQCYKLSTYTEVNKAKYLNT